jgi:hypothetical protein
MMSRLVISALVLVRVAAQSTCPGVNFLAARTVNLRPTATSHVDVIRQPDGSYTGFEAADAAPYGVLSVMPHFERQFAACLPHPIPITPSAPPPIANPSGAGSQLQVSMAIGSANFFVASISADSYTLHFDLFDSQHNLLSENNFTSTFVNSDQLNVFDGIESLLLADLNGDGKLDLIAVFDTNLLYGFDDGGVWVFLGNGDGTFQTGKRQPLTSNGQLMAAQTVAAADLNGDGKLDLVFSSVGYLAITIALGNGDGTFNTETLTIPSPGVSAAFVAIADLNDDGKADLVFAFQSVLGVPTVGVALGNGDATFQTPSTYPILPGVGATGLLAPVAIGDLNGDGIPDIATATGTILFGDGKGAFPTRRDYGPSGSGSVMIADFDGDGIPDLIFGNGNATFLSGNALVPSATVLFGSGVGEFVGAPISGVTAAQDYGLSLVGDFNGDGTPDLVMFSSLNNTTDQLTTFLGRGNGQFFGGPTETVAASSLFSGVVADFNHDGKPDIAVVNGFGQTEIIIFPGRGDGSFATPILLSIVDEEVNFIAAPDLNGDGVPDLVFANGSTLHAWIGKGDGSFVSTFTAEVSTPSVALGDFNGDGRPDIAFVNAASTTVTVLLGKGDGTFPNALNSVLPSVAFGGPGQMAAADFDGDGHPDLAVTLAMPGNGPSAIAVLSGSDRGAFSAIHSTTGFMSEMFAVDLNGDKIPDLVGSGSNGAVVIRLGNGDGTFQPETVIYPQYSRFAIADLNRDGVPDVAILEPWGVTAVLNLKPALGHGHDHRPIN